MFWLLRTTAHQKCNSQQLLHGKLLGFNWVKQIKYHYVTIELTFIKFNTIISRLSIQRRKKCILMEYDKITGFCMGMDLQIA